ncbi:glucose-6-phosphate dehydrogenase assembly protein OpcA, partial [Mycobacterium sp.]|uniref:glucose-6-phosphate dehydrogenase assembly protein OpcA n=1 Tax=Mycobacterium sp. TaxID=1785 RepID=UPI00127A5E09
SQFDGWTQAIEAANAASHEHPSRVIVVAAGDAEAPEARLDAELRGGGDSGAGEVVVLRLSGPLAGHADNVVIPFLLPDIPVVTWWPGLAPAAPAHDPLGKLAIRRITDATNSPEPLSAIKSRLPGSTPGDTDLAWSRIRPQDGVTATLTRTARPPALLPLPRRETRECLAEDLRRLDPDAIYFSALEGIDRVEYV